MNIPEVKSMSYFSGRDLHIWGYCTIFRSQKLRPTGCQSNVLYCKHDVIKAYGFFTSLQLVDVIIHCMSDLEITSDNTCNAIHFMHIVFGQKLSLNKHLQLYL